MSERVASGLDVSHLPTYAYGHRSLMWWGTVGIMLIEGTVFALTIAAYFYIRTRVETWPPGAASPNLLWGSLNTLILLLSLAPNRWAKKAAEKENLAQVRFALVVALAFAAAFLLVRVLEFQTLNVRWDTNAYGSVVWMLMGLHTAHLLTDVLDTVVLMVLMFTGPLEGKRFVDVSENSLYWYFVVLTWLPIYAVIYLGPRFL
jgi:heme/copper-type cytochrome/quinol oxidase subunit 3